MTKIELGKTYRTRAMCEVRIAMVDADGDYPVRGFYKDENGVWVAERWTAYGEFKREAPEHLLDLIECKPKHVRWANVYPDAGPSGVYPTRAGADAAASPNRIACIRLEVEEGECL